MQPRIPFTFDARAHCWLMSSLVSTRISGTFIAVLLSSQVAQHVLVLGIVPPKVQGFALLTDEQHEVPVSPILQPGDMSLDGSTSFWCVSDFSQRSVICSLAEAMLCYIIQVINDIVKDP
ncbi:hypothetical protein WISP_146129 [Willisornis vidua]|uniref:Uncharacterized protein n=1 Tax=Willisornis vidua TaxID=1566151 RepID=A0ABQ9CQE9_9PASS|nr:hypothetical protein WISP_146129 [Willisornis vidua]